MSLTPAHDELAARRKREAVELCGKNRGPHDYMPIEWFYTKDENGLEFKRVSRLLCRVCFCQIKTKELVNNYPEVKF